MPVRQARAAASNMPNTPASSSSPVSPLASTPDALPPWPTVPACYGWLSLDQRGNWRLKDERISHPGLIALLNANYTHDDAGNWLVNNGPQRVYVRLDFAPLVVRLMPGEQLLTHTGLTTEPTDPVCVDELGRVALGTRHGPAAIDDRDLTTFLSALTDDQGAPASDEALSALIEGDRSPLLYWRNHRITPVESTHLAAHLGFVPDPTAAPPSSELDGS